MKRKIFTLLLVIMASTSMLLASEIHVGGIYYDFDSIAKTASVTYHGSEGPEWEAYMGAVVIPDSVVYNGMTYSVTSIGDVAFAGCTRLTSVSIPNSVTSIGVGAFSRCKNLKYATIPNSVTNIGKRAFQSCNHLESVKISNSVTCIDTALFIDCLGLTSVTIPESVTSIGESAFEHCTSLKSIEIPNSVTNIGDWAFKDCIGLIYLFSIESGVSSFYETLAIGNGVTSIGYHVFEGCTGLKMIAIPDNITSIESGAFYGCTGLTSLSIPNSVTSIGSSAFYGCTRLTKVNISDIAAWCGISFGDSDANPLGYAKHLYIDGYENSELIIPEGVTNIGDYAFYGCTGLTSVTIPNSVTSIGNYAFASCTGLISIEIPNSVASIGNSAFRGCTGLTSIYNYRKTPAKLGENTFYDVVKYACTLYVLAGSVDRYKSSGSDWKDFWYIKPIGAETATTENLQVTPSENSVAVVWPSVSGASTYELVIKDKNGNIICTLIFNEAGQLTEIAFAAPSHNGAPQQTQGAGFSFTITGLEQGKSYYITITAKDENGATLEEKKQSFHTDWATAIDEVTNNENISHKIIRNGQVLIQRGEKLYTLQGQEAK